jgi:hypothetical protein
VICPVLENSGGESIFIGFEVKCSNPHMLEGEVDFSLLINSVRLKLLVVLIFLDTFFYIHIDVSIYVSVKQKKYILKKLK